MKIGISTFGSDGDKSGIGQYIIQLLREFVSQSDACAFEVIGYHDERDVFIPPSGSISYLPYGKGLRGPARDVFWHQTLLPLCCRARGFNVLFLPAGNRRLPAYSPCPTVGTVHDFSSIHVRGKYDRKRIFYINYVLPLLIRRLTHVLTVSESSKRDIIEFAGVPKERVTVTPLAVNTAVYTLRDKRQALALLSPKYPLRPPLLLYTARVEHPGKNHERLIRAFARLKRVDKIPHQLVLAGSDWWRAAEVHQAAEKSGFADHILFTGFVPVDDLVLLYQAADIFVFPSLHEGFGLPILEAMACGTPVACSSVSSMPEVAGDAAILFDPYSEESIESAIRKMVTESGMRIRLAARGLEHSKKFSWSKTAARTLEVIRFVAQDHVAARRSG